REPPGSCGETAACMITESAPMKIHLHLHNATPTVPYGWESPTFLGTLTGDLDDFVQMLAEVAQEHPAVSYVSCPEIGRCWRRDGSDSTRLEEILKTDPVTMICREHDVEGCMLCMIDDYHAWLDRRQALRQQLKRERREMTIEERYDLGGE